MIGKLRQIAQGIAQAFRPAAGALPVIVDPKVPNKQQTQASWSKRTPTSTGAQRVAAVDRKIASTDMLTLRNGQTTKSTIHDLAAVSPDLSASVWAYQRMVITKNFTGVARNQDGTANPEATAALQQLLARFNYLQDYADGFSGMATIHSVAEALAKELRLYGACSMELVLDKARLPNRLQPISTTQIDFWDDGTGSSYPVQRIAGQQINLDTPAFFYEVLDQDLLTAYSDSPMEAAIQPTLADAEFTNDVRRVIKRALHPRLDVAVDFDSFRKNMPMELQGDADGAALYQNNYISQIETVVNGLEPDDALVHFDSTKFSYVTTGNSSLDREYEVLQGMNNAKMATGTKAPPSVLGHGSGSQNVASTESLLFMKYAGGVQSKVNSILSRALTLGVRLLGYDVYVQFAFDEINLRPDEELEAFKAMKQSRILELLSIGLMSDEEASIALTGRLPAPGFKSLQGTFFKAGSTDPNAEPNPQPFSNTGQSTHDQATQSDAPQQSKGPANKNIQRVK